MELRFEASDKYEWYCRDRGGILSGLMRFLALLALTAALSASPALAESPREQLIGSWYFKRGIGAPCDRLIRSLEYYFFKDGTYTTQATMSDGGRHKYSGTYVATDTSATAYVDGRTIGPFPYSIKNDVLRINQPDYRCDVELEREP